MVGDGVFQGLFNMSNVQDAKEVSPIMDGLFLSTVNDLSTATQNDSFSVASQDTSPTGIRFKDDESNLLDLGIFMFLCVLLYNIVNF